MRGDISHDLAETAIDNVKLGNVILHGTQKLGSVIYPVTLKLGNMIYHGTQKVG